MLESRAKAIHPYKGIRKYGVNYLGLAPFFTLMLVFIAAPMVYGIVMSFSNWSMSSAKTGIEFVGLKNYEFILSGVGTSSIRFLKSLQNLVYYIPFTIAVGLTISMVLALIVNNITGKLYKVYRGLYFVPTVLPLFLCAQIWKWFFSADTGMIANFLASLGIGPGVVWANTPGYAIALVVLIDIWNSVGFNFIIFSTGMQDVPQELYEAAEIDGASTLQRMRHITLPLIEPIIFFVITYSFISALQVYDVPYMLSYGSSLDNIGGPNQVTLFPVMEMVRNVYNGAKSGLGRATAEGVILMFIIMAITAFQFLTRKKKV